MEAPPDAAFVRAKLESAGRTVMMLPATGTRPAGYGSGWPEIVREFADLIDAPKENTAPALRATMAQLAELDEVEEWVVRLAITCRTRRMPYVAKVVCACSLRWPVSERPVVTWSKMSRRMSVSPTTVRNWYDQGVGLICARLGAGG